MKVVCLYFPNHKSKVTLRLAEALLQISPQVAVGEHWLFLEVSKGYRLTPLDEIHQQVTSIAKKFLLNFSYAEHSDLTTALALAKYSLERKDQLPIEALSCYAFPFHNENLQNEVFLFQSLGFQKLIDCQGVSFNELPSRFSNTLQKAFQHFLWGYNAPWPYFKVCEQIYEQKTLYDDQFVTNLEALLFILNPLLKRLEERLKGRGLKASILCLSLTQENYSVVQRNPRLYRLSLQFPLNDSKVLLDLLKERLQADLQQDPLTAPVLQVELFVHESVASRSLQKDFFCKDREWQEDYEGLLLRLSEKLGEKQIFQAQLLESYLPEKSWQKTVFAPQQNLQKVIELLPPRPLRLFHPPKPIKKREQTLLLDHKPWKTVEWVGPEKICSHWWSKHPERHYYIVTTDKNLKLWVFNCHQNYYLHGVFD